MSPWRGARLAVAAALLVGCGAGHATKHATTLRSATTVRPTTHPCALARAAATHEYPSPPPPAQRAIEPFASPGGAIRAFVTAYINWSAQTVAADMQSLAARSVGQARSAMALAAAETADDYELRRGGVANHGTVQAVAPLPGKPHQYVVVTLESTTATNTTAYQGLRPAWHVALATVTEQRAGEWVVSAWQPEN